MVGINHHFYFIERWQGKLLNLPGDKPFSVAPNFISMIKEENASTTRKEQIHEEKAKFRLRRGCVDQVSTFCQLLQLCHIHAWPTVVVFLYIHGTFAVSTTTASLNVWQSLEYPVRAYGMMELSGFGHWLVRQNEVSGNMKSSYVCQKFVKNIDRIPRLLNNYLICLINIWTVCTWLVQVTVVACLLCNFGKL